MTRPTDDEIEKAADEYAADARKISELEGSDAEEAWYPAGCCDGFAAGARWALEQSSNNCQLEWKRPEEEMPEPLEHVLVVVKKKWFRPAWWEGSCWMASDDDSKVSGVTAWTRIPLPEWLESKE